MSDPYFQKLFAQRVGGENYGKGTAIYKFEKIKRAKRKSGATPSRRGSCVPPEFRTPRGASEIIPAASKPKR